MLVEGGRGANGAMSEPCGRLIWVIRMPPPSSLLPCILLASLLLSVTFPVHPVVDVEKEQCLKSNCAPSLADWQGWFVIDLVSTVPWDLLVLKIAVGNPNAAT